MTLSNIEPEDLIADPSVRAQRFLSEHATELQKIAANMWRWGPRSYSADEISKAYALARRATCWRQDGRKARHHDGPKDFNGYFSSRAILSRCNGVGDGEQTQRC